jgi:hypothetical protein
VVTWRAPSPYAAAKGFEAHVHYAINMALDTPVAKERYRPDDPTSNVLELVLGTADGLLERINRVRQVHAPGCAEYPNSSIYDVVRSTDALSVVQGWLTNVGADLWPDQHVYFNEKRQRFREIVTEYIRTGGSLAPPVGIDPVEFRASAARSLADPWHTSDTTPPDDYPAGPLSGTKQELVRWILGAKDRRTLDAQIAAGHFWGRQVKGRDYEVYFREQTRFAFANLAKLKGQQVRGTETGEPASKCT